MTVPPERREMSTRHWSTTENGKGTKTLKVTMPGELIEKSRISEGKPAAGPSREASLSTNCA